MRISDDTRKTVVFLGVTNFDQNGREVFVGAGTGFFIHHGGWSHLVTCRHVAKQLEGTPFVVRGNWKNGTACVCQVDRIEWFYHPDETVDVAVLPCGMPEGADWFVIPPDMVLDESGRNTWDIGAGDLAYVVGLFRLLHGNQRNMPMVHTGNIAMLPEDEKIPVIDRALQRSVQVEGYLVEANTLDGLSGAPVFARSTVEAVPDASITLRGGLSPIQARSSLYAVGRYFLLGMWQGSWDGAPHEQVVANHRGPVRVPLGMGVVVPAAKILEALSMPEVQADRKAKMELANRLHAEQTDSAGTETPTTDENLRHRDDFNRLLPAAVECRKPDDES